MNKEKAALIAIKAVLDKTHEAFQDDDMVYDDGEDVEILLNAFNTITNIVYAVV